MMENNYLNYTFSNKITERYGHEFLKLYKKVYRNSDYKYLCRLGISWKESCSYNDLKPSLENFLKLNDIKYMVISYDNIALKNKNDLKIVKSLLPLCDKRFYINNLMKITSLNYFKEKCQKYQDKQYRTYRKKLNAK